MARTPRFLRGTMVAGVLALAVAAGGPARAQLIDRYFPAGVPGFGSQPGVTVESRARPEYDPPGVRLGGIVVRPAFSTGLGHTSNALGRRGGRSSPLVQTSASLLAGSDWGRHAIGGFLSIDDQRTSAVRAQSATAWTAALGGTAEFGRDRLTLGLAHLDLYQTARSLDGLPIDRPGRYRVNTARAAYTWRGGRLAVAPGLSLGDTRYDDVFVAGRRVAQGHRDRVAVEGNVTLRWEMAPLRDLVLDLRAVRLDHARREPGQPGRDSTTLSLLGGIDYAADALWRVRALAGVQHRAFADPALKPVTGPMAEASVIWAPSGLTTVTATLSRRIEDGADPATVSFAFTGARLAVDHELMRNLLLAGAVDLQQAEYQQRGGRDRLLGVSVGATWLIDRRLRATASWDWTTRRRAGGEAIDEGVALLRLRLAM